jgi:hypothetical protein
VSHCDVYHFGSPDASAYNFEYCAGKKKKWDPKKFPILRYGLYYSNIICLHPKEAKELSYRLEKQL